MIPTIAFFSVAACPSLVFFHQTVLGILVHRSCCGGPFNTELLIIKSFRIRSKWLLNSRK